MIRVACPHCGRTYRTQTEGMGKTAVCTKCRKPFRIGDKRVKFEWQSTDLGEDSWVGVPAPEEKKELKHCIMCDAPLEDGAVRCLECGANQVTGVMHRPKPKVETGEPGLLSALPVKGIVIGLIVIVVGAGVYWGIRALTEKTIETSQQLVYQSMTRKARDHLEQGGDAYSFVQAFGGEVTDENLPGYVRLLSSNNPEIRNAAAMLIGCGRARQLGPLLEWANGGGSRDTLRRVLAFIGSRRLVELAGHEDAATRQSAAEALCLVSGLEVRDDTSGRLADPMPTPARIELLFEILEAERVGRYWPEAVGSFQVIVADETAPFEAFVEQIGQRFYLRLPGLEFRSVPEAGLTFEFPLKWWCVGTGLAVDSEEVSSLLGGTVRLASPAGASWRGTIELVLKRSPVGSLPGFLPIESPSMGERIELPLTLER